MSLINWLKTKYLGVDLEEEDKREAAYDAQIIAANNAKIASGQYTPEEAAIIQAHLGTMQADDAGTSQENVNDAFVEGAKEGLQNLGDKIQTTTSFSFGAVFKLIPWQAWVALVILIFWWLGGFAFLRGILAKGKE